MYNLNLNAKEKEFGFSKDAKIGDLMIIIEEGSFFNHILLKIYSSGDEDTSLISLTDPDFTWGGVNFKVRFLEPGESVTLTVK